MRALVLEDLKKTRIVDLPKPVCGPDEVLLEVINCSVCRSDAKMWLQGHRDLVFPRTLGHEICGRQVDTGERFVVWPAKKCGVCDYCLRGKENLCEKIEVIGFNREGGFAQFIKVPKESLLKVPDDLPSEVACMTELLASAINALEQVSLKENQSVLIYGGGPAGLLLGLACKEFKANPTIIEVNRHKLSRIREFCEKAKIELNPVSLNRFDVVVNAAPDPEIFLKAIPKIRSSGFFCIFSGFMCEKNFSTNLLNEVHYRQLMVTGAYGNTIAQMQTALKVFQKNVALARLLIDRQILLDEVAEVFVDILSGKALKFVVNVEEKSV